MHKPSDTPPVGETRAPGMDHALYPYRTLPDTPAIQWPNGARIALTVTLVLDHWELTPPPDASPDPRIISPLGKFFPDWLTWSQHQYGARVGIFRILAALDRFGVRPSVALGAAAATACPELVDECARRGAAFLAHGTHATRRITSRVTEAEERAHIAESRAAIQAATGRAPTGWCGQDFNQSPRTPDLLAEAGFTYTTDWSNDDRPYLLRSLVALPAHSEWNDLECMWLRQVSPRVWADGIAEAFAVLHAEGGATFNLTLHPHVTGQAHRIKYLDAALSRILGRGQLWQATTDEVAAHARTGLPQRNG
jgi:peptidoglycan/xylan/chitin deacetylase (PgdA/CDA1 family)